MAPIGRSDHLAALEKAAKGNNTSAKNIRIPSERRGDRRDRILGGTALKSAARTISQHGRIIKNKKSQHAIATEIRPNGESLGGNFEGTELRLADTTALPHWKRKPRGIQRSTKTTKIPPERQGNRRDFGRDFQPIGRSDHLATLEKAAKGIKQPTNINRIPLKRRGDRRDLTWGSTLIGRANHLARLEKAS